MRQQLPPQIRKIEQPSGVRYEVIVDTGTVNGKRKQTRRRLDDDKKPFTEASARAFLAKTQVQVNGNTFIHRRGTTVEQTVEQWLRGRTAWRDTTLTGHKNRLKPFVALYGDLPIQDLKKSHIDTLMARLETGDIPRPKNKKRRPSNGQSRRNVLSSIRQLLDSEVEQGRLPRNVAQYVDTPKLDSEERPTLTVEQLRKVLAVTADDRDGHQHQLGSIGLRKQELAGLMWKHIDMNTHTMEIVQTRTIADGKVVIGKPKTDRSMSRPGKSGDSRSWEDSSYGTCKQVSR